MDYTEGQELKAVSTMGALRQLDDVAFAAYVVPGEVITYARAYDVADEPWHIARTAAGLLVPFKPEMVTA